MRRTSAAAQEGMASPDAVQAKIDKLKNDGRKSALMLVSASDGWTFTKERQKAGEWDCSDASFYWCACADPVEQRRCIRSIKRRCVLLRCRRCWRSEV